MGTPRFTPEFKEEPSVRSLSAAILLRKSLSVLASLHTVFTSGCGPSGRITASSMPGIYWKPKVRS
ncbi:Uncharacterised protein [Salmonella enterica subsp. enterica]|uniref:Uncharacterized protein n=1 Tax=Salmonella enterica I TaxID=59201 RepID=A0A379UPT2_SALET|nr:Uncharacterised protein [Salmonella enterica subsp. enterica]